MTPELCVYIRSLLKKAVRSSGGKDVVQSYLLDGGIAQEVIDQHRNKIRDIYRDCLADADVGLESQSSGSDSERDRRRRSSRTSRASKESRDASSPSTFSSPSNSLTSAELFSTNESREREAGGSVQSPPKKPDAYGKIWVTDEHRRAVTCVFSNGKVNYIGEHIINAHFKELQPLRKNNRISLQFKLDSQTKTRIIDFIIKADYPHDILFSENWEVDKKPQEMRDMMLAEHRPAEGMKRTNMHGNSLSLRLSHNGVKSEGSDVGYKPRRERQSEAARASTPNPRQRTAGGRIDHRSRSNSPLITPTTRSRTQSTPVPGDSSVTMASPQSSEPIKVVVEIIQPQPQPAGLRRSHLPRRRRLQNSIRAMSSSSCFPRDTATDSDDRSESESNRLFDREPLGGASASDNSTSTAPDPPSRDGESMQKLIEEPQEIIWGF